MRNPLRTRTVSIATAVFVTLSFMLMAACGGGSGSEVTNKGTAAPAELPTNLTLTVGVPNDCGSPDFSAVAGTGGGNWVCTGLVTDGLLSTNYDTGQTAI